LPNKSLPFRYRMMLTIIVTVLLPMTVVNVLTFTLVREQMLRDSGDWLEGITAYTGQTFDGYLLLMQGATKNPLFDYTLMEIFDDKRISPNGRQMEYTLQERVQINGWLAMLSSMDENILSTVFVDQSGVRFYVGEHIAEFDEASIVALSGVLGGKSYISKPVYDAKGRPVLCIARTMINPSNFEPAATLLIYFKLGILEQISGASERSIRINIIDAQGKIVLDPDPARIGETFNFDDASNSYATYRLQPNDWTLVGSIATSVLFEKINNLQKWVMTINFLLAVATILIIFVVSSSLTGPLKKLAVVMQNAYKTQFREVTVPIRRRDEIGMISLSFNQMVKHIHLLIGKVIETEHKRKQSQITALQAQINPHFLYNSLYMIAMQAELDENYKIAEMAYLLSKLLRYSVGKDSEAVEVRQECDHLQTYLRLMQYRFPKIEAELDVDEEVQGWVIMRLILQPIVENAIIHGLVPKDSNGKVSISIKRLDSEDQQRWLRVRIADDGIGMSGEQAKKLTEYLQSGVENEGTERGIGMKNVYERLSFFYGEQFRFRLSSREGDGTVCEIEIPAKMP